MNIPRAFFLLLITILLVLSIAMVLPFLQYFLLSLLLAYLLMPIQDRLEKRVSPKIAAGSIVLFASVVIIIPLVYVFRLAVSELTTLVEDIRTGDITLSEPENYIEDVLGIEVDLFSWLQIVSEEVEMGDVLGIADTLVHLLIGIGLTVFLLYYFLKDGDKFMAWFRQTVPLSDDVQDRIYRESDQIMKAVLIGHIFVAIIQGVLAGVGLVVTGIPNPVLWTVVMVVLSLLPLVGSFLVWGPAVIYLFIGGQTVLAVFLALWGIIVVGVSDDYLRPIIVDRYAEVNPSVIIIGVLGGIFVFGVMGIFFGPLIIGILRMTLDIFREEFVNDDENLAGSS